MTSRPPSSAANTRQRCGPGATAGRGSSRSWPSRRRCGEIIYTTNAIESLNYQLRKIIKNRGHFPNDEAAVKLLWLAICNIEDKRASDRARLEGKARENRSKTVNKLIEGTCHARMERGPRHPRAELSRQTRILPKQMRLHPTYTNNLTGSTSGPNGAGLCEACNQTKEAPGWSTRPRPGPRHTIETRTPTGHTYRSTAPPLPGTDPRDQRQDMNVRHTEAQAGPPGNAPEAPSRRLSGPILG